MGVISNITVDHHFDIGTDRTLRFRITDPLNNDQPIAAGLMATWNISWFLRQEPTDDEIIITKTKAAGQIAITSLLDPLPVSEGGTGATIEVVDVFINPADTVVGGLPIVLPGRYYQTLKRTNSGSQWDMSKGTVILQMSAAR